MIPNGAPLSFGPSSSGEEGSMLSYSESSSACFANTSVKATWLTDDDNDDSTGNGAKPNGTVLLEFTSVFSTAGGGRIRKLFSPCSDLFGLTALNGIMLKRIAAPSLLPFNNKKSERIVTRVYWTPPRDETSSERHDLETQGIRVFRFAQGGQARGIASLLSSISETALLFLGEIRKPLTNAAEQRNIDFLNGYTNFTYKRRTPSSSSSFADSSSYAGFEVGENFNTSLIESGDFFGINRLDGLDPMLAWAMGSTTGHTTVALRLNSSTPPPSSISSSSFFSHLLSKSISSASSSSSSSSSVLYICESTSKDVYWDTNGIQCTEWKEWIRKAKEASFNLVWLPLQRRSGGTGEAFKNNIDNVYSFIESVLGNFLLFICIAPGLTLMKE